MDLNQLKVDANKVEEGEWIGDLPDVGDLRLKVRGLGNRDYRRLMNRLAEAVPRQKKQRGRIDPDEMDKITNKCLLETVLLDWENLSQGGQQIPFSKDLAKQLLEDRNFERFRNAVLTAANQVGEATLEELEEAAGNSATA